MRQPPSGILGVAVVFALILLPSIKVAPDVHLVSIVEAREHDIVVLVPLLLHTALPLQIFAVSRRPLPWQLHHSGLRRRRRLGGRLGRSSRRRPLLGACLATFSWLLG